ncbi:sorting nexin-3 isoform X2 [Cyanistes caeruleus]|uniref:sorting nexin-3 isoform X2 n=1 Tax=Cyanistes caeruleus TaxID=156563 RepID=UPI000CDB709D|nr:sorting nexin-3 isoform X2 [Cyanistes caeruleus]
MQLGSDNQTTGALLVLLCTACPQTEISLYCEQLHVCLQTNLPIFKLKESTVRRRYSDFEWLRNELERESKVVVPPLPGKALLRQLPFRGDDGIFDDSFIEERKQALEQFINKVAGHPLAQNERCLHMFLQDEVIDKNYTPSKIRHT